MKSKLHRNKQFILASLIFSIFGTGAAFALPYTPTDQELDPSCAPGATDCYVSLISSQLGDVSGSGNGTYIDVNDASQIIRFYTEASGSSDNGNTPGTSKQIFKLEAQDTTGGSTNNFYAGFQAGDQITSPGFSNFIGFNSGMQATTADQVNAFGYRSGYQATGITGTNLIGVNNGRNAINIQYSNLIGYQVGAATGATYANAIGYRANAGGPNAIAIGFQAGYNTTNAYNSIFIGADAGASDTINNTSSDTSIAIGRNAATGGFANSIAIGRGIINSATQQLNIGNVLYATGIYNSNTRSSSPVSGGRVGIGTNSPNQQLEITGNFRIPATTSTVGTIYMGASRFIHGYGSDNTFMGLGAGNFTLTGDTSVGIGTEALASMTNPFGNVAIGAYASTSSTTGRQNVAIGWEALLDNVTGSENIAIGGQTMGGSGNNVNFNTIVGGAAGYNIAGDENTGLGYNNFPSLTTGTRNIAIGMYSPVNLTTGDDNIIIGYNINTPASNTSDFLSIGNLIFASGGFGAGTTVGSGNVGIGENAPIFKFEVADTASSGGAIGMSVSNNSTAGVSQYVLSEDSGSGNADFYIQRYGSTHSTVAKRNAVEIINGNNAYLALGSNSTERLRISQNGAVSIANTNSSYTLEVGNNSVSGIVARFVNSTGTCDINPTTTSLSCSSDLTLKKNITDLDSSLSLLTQLRTVTYNWNTQDDNTTKTPGFIAQEVEQVFPFLVTTDPTTNLKSLNYTLFTPYIIKSIQEINANFTSLDASKENTLGYLIKKFLEDSLNGLERIFVKEVRTEKICVGQTCVTEDELKTLLQNGSVQNNVSNNAPVDEESDVVTTDENNDEEISSNLTTEEPAEDTQLADDIVPEAGEPSE